VNVRAADVRDEAEALPDGVDDGLADQVFGKRQVELPLRHRSVGCGRIHAPGAEPLQVDGDEAVAESLERFGDRLAPFDESRDVAGLDLDARDVSVHADAHLTETE